MSASYHRKTCYSCAIARTAIRDFSTQLVASALRRKHLLRGPCEICGSPNSEGHHDDYGRPLKVRWLCRKHHKQLHAMMRKEAFGREAGTIDDALNATPTLVNGAGTRRNEHGLSHNFDRCRVWHLRLHRHRVLVIGVGMNNEQEKIAARRAYAKRYKCRRYYKDIKKSRAYARKCMRKYRDNNREKVRAYSREYNRKWFKTYFKKNPQKKEEYKQRQRLWNQRVGLEYFRKRAAEYRARHVEQERSRQRIYTSKNYARIQQRRKQYAATHHEQIIIKNRIYKSRPEKQEQRRQYEHKRAWIIQRLITMARDDGTHKMLQQKLYFNGRQCHMWKTI